MSIKTQLKPGSELQGGKYRILSVLGQGGFGITYEAEQVALGRKVAVKEFFMEEYCNRNGDTSQVSVPSVGSKETVDRFRAKFVKEAKMIAGLNNPHIVKILDVFEENGTAYYVMEYHDKGSLKDEVAERGALPEEDAVERIREVADALRYLHDQNILHLDVKPGNVLMGGNGEMVLIDFGVSKCYDEEGEQTSSTPVAKSKGYAPSELYISASVSHFSPATDIYSLGATFYHMVTGMVPPDASAVSEEGIDLSRFTGLSEPTRHAIEAAMQPRRKDRPQSVAEFLKILDGTADVRDDDRTDFDSHCGEDSTRLDDGKAKSAQACGTRNRKPSPAPKPSWLRWAVPSVACLLMAAGVFFFMRPEPVPTTGTLTVVSKPFGASVYADIGDSLTLIGTTPLAVEISRGTHDIVVHKDGNEPYTTDVTIADAAVAVNATLTAKPVEPARPATPRPTTGTHNGHDWVDLGLSVKWATCNVGASAPSDYGNHYAWGEVRTKSEYYETNYTTWEKSMGDIAGDPAHDAARYNWGGRWRLPTKAECKELIDNCTWTWTEQGGHEGYRVTSRKNGAGIFLPAAGSHYESSLVLAGAFGYYWSSTPYGSNAHYAIDLEFYDDGHLVGECGRFFGLSVRPVSE